MENKVDYNAEPVYYCKQCLSLKILSIPKMEDSEYCDDCGSTSVEQCSIEEWEKLYKERFNHKYLENFNTK